MATNDNKPTFIFFKMPWCGPCKAFDDKQYPTMEADQELKQYANVKRIIWNGMPDRGPVLPLPEQYKGMVNYGPYLWLEAGMDQQGKPVGVTYRGDNTAAAVKAWIIKTINEHELFARFRGNGGAKKPRQTVAAATNRPAQQPASHAHPHPHPGVTRPTPPSQQPLGREPAPSAASTKQHPATRSAQTPAKPAGVVPNASADAKLRAMKQTPTPAAQVISGPAAAVVAANNGPKFSYRRAGTQTARPTLNAPGDEI